METLNLLEIFRELTEAEVKALSDTHGKIIHKAAPHGDGKLHFYLHPNSAAYYAMDAAMLKIDPAAFNRGALLHSLVHPADKVLRDRAVQKLVNDDRLCKLASTLGNVVANFFEKISLED